MVNVLLGVQDTNNEVQIRINTNSMKNLNNHLIPPHK